MTLDDRLQQGITQLNLSVPSTLHAQLLAYITLLDKWNHAYNLTAVRDITQMIPKHLLDSLAIAPHVRGINVLDVGTGAGLPGLILAMARPELQCVLLDSNKKKTRFVQQVVLELGLKNVTVVSARIENFKPPHLFDTVTSRAYTNLKRFYQQTIGFCAPQGQLLAMKGVFPETELDELQDVKANIQTKSIEVPQLNAERHIVLIEPC